MVRITVLQHACYLDPLNADALGPMKFALIRVVSSFQGANILYEVGTWSSVLIREVSFNPIHPIGNSVTKQKPCTKV